jgi:hypothetical protein
MTERTCLNCGNPKGIGCGKPYDNCSGWQPLPQPEEKKGVCVWERCEFRHRDAILVDYKPGCRKHRVNEIDVNWNFCPYCGRKIQVNE